MTRLWTRTGVAGVLAAVLTLWLVQAARLLVDRAPFRSVLAEPSLLLLYAAGPAVLCAVPLVLLSRAVLPRTGRQPWAFVLLGLVGGLVVGAVQTAVLLSQAPWDLPPRLLRDLVGLPALAGAVGGVVAGLVDRRGDVPETDGHR